ncbi:hypothetical protein [Streptomyces chrestomyceticus]|uniref:hypothetical protein n=1 Tax=Streptomyces chrestomyceticus TaxID=68185 RepID=UPI00340C352A
MANKQQPQPETADPDAATETLREALALAGIVLPSLAPDLGSPTLCLVNLGRVRAETAMRLAAAVRRGAAE